MFLETIDLTHRHEEGVCTATVIYLVDRGVIIYHSVVGSCMICPQNVLYLFITVTLSCIVVHRWFQLLVITNPGV